MIAILAITLALVLSIQGQKSTAVQSKCAQFFRFSSKAHIFFVEVNLFPMILSCFMQYHYFIENELLAP
jgi:hypothetical protein